MRCKPSTRIRVLSTLTLSYLSLNCGAVLAQGTSAHEDAYSFSVDMHGAVHAMGERCIELEQGGVVGFSFSSEYPVDFNIHHHGETETTYPVKVDDQTIYQGNFFAESNHEYCFMWQNKTYREATWVVLTSIDVTAIESATR